MISEATRTIEDSQTAQALHGLLSLKADSAQGSFPALLKAVGQQIAPQPPSTAPTYELLHQQNVEVSQSQEKTVSQKLAQAAALAERTGKDHVKIVQHPHDNSNTQQPKLASPPPQPPQPQASPQQQQQQIHPQQQIQNQQQHAASKARAGSVMDLLLQMQSQANAAANPLTASSPSSVKEESQLVSTSFPLGAISTLLSPTSSNTSTTTTASRKVISSTNEAGRPGVTQITLPVAPAAAGSPGGIPKVSAAALTQLIQAQVPPGTPVQCKPSQLTPTSNPQAGSTKVANLPAGFRLLTQSAAGSPTVYQAPTGEFFLPSQIQLPGGGSPIILQPTSVVLSNNPQPTVSTSTARNTPIRTSQDEPNKSPLKKRPYPFTPNILSSAHASGEKVGSSDNPATPSSSVTVVVQQVDNSSPSQSNVAMPQIVNTVSLANKNNNGNSVAPDSNRSVNPAPASSSSNHSQLTVLISEGYDDIFRHIRDQMNQLKTKHQSSGGDAMTSVIDKVLKDSMVRENGQVKCLSVKT